MQVRKPTAERIGDLLKRLRTSYGLSQAQLATRANVSKPWIAQVELGNRKHPEHDLLLRVARALDIDPNLLLASAGYSVARPPEPAVPSLEHVLHELHAVVQAEKQRPVAVHDESGAIVDLLPPSPALADVLDRLELGAEMLMSATRELRHLMTISARNSHPGRNTQAHEENYLAPGASESATVAGQLAVDMATVLPPELAAAYAHELASLTADERLAALNALLAYVRDEERRRGGRRGARCADVPQPGGTPSQTVGSDASD